MKTKIKQLMCMVLAFVTTFTVTVTAYASTNADGFDFFVGIYYKEDPEINGDGNVKVREDTFFNLFAYTDFNFLCYVSGRNGEGKIVNGTNGFDVAFDSVTKCKKDGTPPANPGKIQSYNATGAVSKGLTKAVIKSDQSNMSYILNKFL